MRNERTSGVSRSKLGIFCRGNVRDHAVSVLDMYSLVSLRSTRQSSVIEYVYFVSKRFILFCLATRRSMGRFFTRCARLPIDRKSDSNPAGPDRGVTDPQLFRAHFLSSCCSVVIPQPLTMDGAFDARASNFASCHSSYHSS